MVQDGILDWPLDLDHARGRVTRNDELNVHIACRIWGVSEQRRNDLAPTTALSTGVQPHALARSLQPMERTVFRLMRRETVPRQLRRAVLALARDECRL